MSQLADVNIQSNVGMFTFVIFYICCSYFLSALCSERYCKQPGLVLIEVFNLLIPQKLTLVNWLILNKICNLSQPVAKQLLMNLAS